MFVLGAAVTTLATTMGFRGSQPLIWPWMTPSPPQHLLVFTLESEDFVGRESSLRPWVPKAREIRMTRERQDKFHPLHLFYTNRCYSWCPQHHQGGSRPEANLCGQSHPKSWWRQENRDWIQLKCPMPALLAQQLTRPHLHPLLQPDSSTGSQVTQRLVQVLQDGSGNIAPPWLEGPTESNKSFAISSSHLYTGQKTSTLRSFFLLKS